MSADSGAIGWRLDQRRGAEAEALLPEDAGKAPPGRAHRRTDRHPRLYFCIRANHKTGGLIDRQERAEEFDPDFRWQRIPGERPGRGARNVRAAEMV